MVKFNESDGVWRTIGGRRVFIRSGQSLSDAMKESGKFKNAKKKQDEKDDSEQARKVKTLSGEYEKDNKGREVSQKEYDEFREAYKKGEISKEDYRNDNYDALKEKITKSGERDKRTTEQETPRDSSGKEITKEELRQVAESSKGAVKEMHQGDVRRQTEDIEKASGLKVKEAFETDLYGNGKEDRFMLDDDRWVSHTKEALGSKQDTWSINEFKNGSVESKDFNSYDDMIKHLGGSKRSEEIKETSRVKEIREQNQKWRDSLNDTKYSQKQLDDVYKNKDYTEVIEYLSKSDLRKMKEAASDMNNSFPGTEGYKAARDYLQRKENEAAAKFLDKSNNSNNNAYKKAFQEYKKKHPNSKLNLQKFIDMSEGK